MTPPRHTPGPWYITPANDGGLLLYPADNSCEAEVSNLIKTELCPKI